MTNELSLIEITNKAGLAVEHSKALIEGFTPYMKAVSEIAEEAKTIKVTDETQVETMALAGIKRKEIAKKRIELEKHRQVTKARALAESKAIDGLANVIKAIIEPVEQYLLEQENYAKYKEEARLNALYEQRVNELSKYVEDISVFDIKNMSEEVYAKLVVNAKEAKEKAIKAEQEAEQERIKAEEEAKKENERIRQENIRLRAEAEKAEKQRLLEQEKKQKEIDKARAETQKIQDELNAKLNKERAEQAEKAEAERQAILAPDKDKLITLAGDLEKFALPAVKSNEANKLIMQVQNALADLSQKIREKARTL